MQQLLELQVDVGEASAIALALETDDCTIILDDFKARKLANKLGLKITKVKLSSDDLVLC